MQHTLFIWTVDGLYDFVQKNYYFISLAPGVFLTFNEFLKFLRRIKNKKKHRKLEKLIQEKKEKQALEHRNKVIHYPFVYFFLNGHNQIRKINYSLFDEGEKENLRKNIEIFFSVAFKLFDVYCQSILSRIDKTEIEFEIFTKKNTFDWLGLFEKEIKKKIDKEYSLVLISSSLPILTLFANRVNTILSQSASNTDKALLVFNLVREMTENTYVFAQSQVDLLFFVRNQIKNPK